MLTENSQQPTSAFKDAVCANNAERVRELLERHPELRETIDSPLPDYAFGIHALYAAVQRGDKDTIDVLLNAGANINKRTEWWAGGFGVLDECDAAIASFLMERGALLDVHSAARLGMTAELQNLVARNPESVHARGGDGQMPLHFAASVEIAQFLVENDADINARDIDHESTAAQYMLRVTQKRHYARNRQDVARYLVLKGCETDILMAAALGDVSLVERHLKNDPECIRTSVSAKWFPKRNPHAGGSIYIWVLGANQTAHTVARDFNHQDVFSLLMKHTPVEMKLALACELGDEDAFQELLRTNPVLVQSLTEEDMRKLPSAAQNNNKEAVRLMLKAGWPVNMRGEMGATALHWAGFNGNAEMAREILSHAPQLDLKSQEYDGTALEWAEFASRNSVHRPGADFKATIAAIREAGGKSL